jgi:hypothetical protein
VPQYVVTRPYPDSNVGSNLSNLAGAIWLARRLGRTLVVDWRGMRQLGDDSANYFSEFFATPEEILGVPVLYAPAAVGDYHADGEWLAAPEARAVGAAGTAAAETIVLQAYHGLDRIHPGPESAWRGFLRSCFRHVRPALPLAQAIDRWGEEHLVSAVLIGVNVRTGNGHYFQKGMRYASRIDVSLFDDGDRFVRALAKACSARVRHLPPALRRDYSVFYATDSEPMSRTLAALPHAVTRRRRFPPYGEGDLYRFDDGPYTDRDSVLDTLADMFLLAECDALVYNSSNFNQYARVVTGSFGGNLVHIDSLFLRTRVRRARSLVAGRLAS